ncbi:hypothetical protein PRK78_004760 [Emydomyces testavorans]|uniref:Uncharacterized protein n=1 Tax=Emydomyces testavorans TaxID=2070801 RepID=A0AAF0IK31_9EURO|nr:hypothetical protein PRK78_004760 [Emydomyces testavorans]
MTISLWWQESPPGHSFDTVMEDSPEAHTVGSSPLEGRTRRRHGNQGSSSFRLGSAFSTIKRSNSNPGARSIRQAEPHRATKRPINQPDLSVRKRQSQGHGSQHRPSPGAPSRGHPIINQPVATSSAYEADQADSINPSEAGPSSSPNISQSHGSTLVGLDTDPAQIVNLALSLSESRRRSLSGRAVPVGVSRDRRLSAISSRTPIHLPRGDDWQSRSQIHRDSLQQPYQFSQPFQSPVPFLDEHHDLDPSEFSTGTISRAEKAKQHFELFMEYLRLLPHLPPLHPSAANSAKQGDPSSAFRTSMPGRVYNPLQYIRNRKARFRERSTINSEEVGWEDVDKVRNWVDGVINALDSKEYGTDECVQLPPLKTLDNVVEESQEPFSSPGRTNTTDSSKPRRPRIDWVVSPSDLLADAAWVESGSNKLKLEDKDGNKIFPTDTKLKPIPLISEKSPPEDVQKDQMRDLLYSTEQLPRFTSIRSRGSLDESRGLRSHRFSNSVHLSPNHRHSRESSKSRWRKALSSSRSSSDSSRNNGSYIYSGSSAKHDIPGQKKAERTLLPPLDTSASGTKPLVLPCNSYAESFSSVDDRAHKASSRPSFEMLETQQDKPMFPSITANLSPPWSRESSPSRKPQVSLHRSLDHQGKKNQGSKAPFALDSQGLGAKSELKSKQPGSPDSDSLKQTLSHNVYVGPQNANQCDDSPGRGDKSGKEPDSKRRGIFKSGRIAELVGNEVSKVGDLIRKKDSSGHSRHSSSASSISEYVNADDDTGGKRRKLKPRLTRHPTQPDAGSQPRDQLIDSSRYRMSNLPTFTSSLKRSDIHTGSDMSAERSDGHLLSKLENLDQLGPASETGRNEMGISAGYNEISHASQNLELQKKWLRQEDDIRTSHDASLQTRPKLTETTRNWSLSSRSIPKYSHSYNIDKGEIIRVRAHLLSTGVKAQEICHHANAVPSASAFNPLCANTSNNLNSPIPYMRSQETAIASTKRLTSAVDDGVHQIQNSISKFTSSDLPQLTSDLDYLDRLITSTLTARLREVSNKADHLNGQLATTGTLTIKQLNDAVDKGIRKRKRRFRWVSRLGYVLLEWVLVGVMWWVWTIVMLWKLLRGIWRGTVSGVRWILWL